MRSKRIPPPNRAGRLRMLVAIAVLPIAAERVRAAGTILFDATKAESAANADWVIDADAHNLSWSKGPAVLNGGNESNPQRVPTPAASGIGAFTSDTYWNGAFSSFGVGLVKQGFGVESLPYNGSITYGNSANPQDLSHYSAFVLSEPNILFSATEKTAILTYVKNGGGLIIITDHSGSDRNNDGKDSVAVVNDLFSNNSVQINPFGVTDNANDVSPNSTTLNTSDRNPLTQGPTGVLSHLAYHNGSTFTIDPTVNPTVTAAAWSGTTPSNSTAMAVYGQFGSGHFALLGDTSPVDDGSGDPNDTSIIDGWDYDGGKQLMLNAANYVSPGIIHWATTDGLWSRSANWFENTLPSSGNDVRIVTSDYTSPTITDDFAGAGTLNSLTLDNITSGSTTLQIAAGAVLRSATETIAADGSANIAQTGGTNAAGILSLGARYGSGTYNLSGTATLSVGTALIVGGSGYTAFSQSNGTVALANGASLSIADTSGYSTYTLTGGTLTSQGNEFVGTGGIGVFTQSGGINSTTGTLFLGYNSGSSGSYTLSPAAILSAHQEVIGNSGYASFLQNGGTNTIGSAGSTGDLTVAVNASSTGYFTLSSGTLVVSGNESIGVSGSGVFAQNGGLHVIGSSGSTGTLAVGAAGTGSGIFSLGAGTLIVTTVERIGGSGNNPSIPNGSFNQTGGSHTIGTPTANGSLSIGVSTTGGSGTYDLYDPATLSVNGNCFVGGTPAGTGTAGSGTLAIHGGAMNVTGSLSVAGSSQLQFEAGALTVGTLNVNGDPTRFNWTAGALRLTASALDISSTGLLGATPSINSGQRLAVDRTVNIAAGSTLSVANTSASSVNFSAGALINAGTLNVGTAGVVLGTAAGTSALTNTGTLVLSYAGVDVLGAAAHSGLLVADHSSVTFHDGITLGTAGVLQLTDTDTFTIAGGNFINNSASTASTVTGANLAMIGSGTQVLNLGTPQAAALVWGSLEIGGATTLSINGGDLQVNDLILDGATVPDLTHVVVLNSRTISTPQSIVTDTGNTNSVIFFTSTTGGYTFSNNAVFTNAGVFNNQTNQSFAGSGTFQNNGIFRKQASTGVTSFAIPLNNNGLIDVRSGTLSIEAGGTGAGTALISAGAAMTVHSATFTSGDLVNDGTLDITAGSVATFGNITGKGTTNVTGVPASLTATSLTQAVVNLADATLSLAQPGTVGKLALTNSTLNGPADNDTDLPATPASLTVTGAFQAPTGFSVHNGLALNLGGTGTLASVDVTGGSNSSVNFLPGSAFTHDDTGTLTFHDPLVSIGGEFDVNHGTVLIPNGGSHGGTIIVAAGAALTIGGDFQQSANVDVAGAIKLATAPGNYYNYPLGGVTGHVFSGALRVRPGITLEIGPADSSGTDPSGITFDSSSTVSFDSGSTFHVAANSGVVFANQQPLNLGSATLNGSVVFETPTLSIGTLNIAGTSSSNVSFQSYGGTQISSLNLTSGSVDSLYYYTPVIVANANFSGGTLNAGLELTGTMSWTGGVLQQYSAQLKIDPGATLSISGNGGTINGGVLSSSGVTQTTGDLILASGDGQFASLNVLDGTTRISGTLAVSNTGTLTDGSASSNGYVSVSGGSLSADKILMGNTAGGTGSLYVSGGSVSVAKGISGSVSVGGGNLTVMGLPAPDDADPVLSHALVVGYQNDGNIDVYGGTLSAPRIGMGITAGHSGTLYQSDGTISVTTLAIGGDGLGGGAGVGTATWYGGTLNVGTILMGSTAGGVGAVTISGSANVRCSSMISAATASPVNSFAMDEFAALSVGTLDLSSVNSFSFSGGSIAINNGVFNLPAGGVTIGEGYYPAVLSLHAAAVRNGPLTISYNATLSGTGTLTTAASVLSNGTLAVGDYNPDNTPAATGKLTFQSGLTLSSDANGHANLQLALGAPTTPGGTFDQIVVQGGVFTVGGATLQLLIMNGLQLNHAYPIVIAPGGSIDYSSAFSNLTGGTNYNAGMAYVVSYSGSEIDVTFTAVPEPAVVMPMAVALSLLHRRRRKARVN